MAIFKRISYWVLVVILISLILIVGVQKLLGYRTMAVISGSMEPDLPVGSMILIQPREFENIHIGDDISFVFDNSLTVVTHRVVDIDTERQSFTTQGIANQLPDGNEVYYKNVLGVVILTVPCLGYVISFLSTLAGKTIAIIIILALLFVPQLIKKFGNKSIVKDQDK